MRQALRRSSILLLLALAAAASAGAGQVELISKVPPRSVFDTGTGASEIWSISADGRYVLFLSEAANLVPGQDDFNFGPDVFLYDRVTGTTELVSRSESSPTSAGSFWSYDASLSADGRFVAFTSEADNLFPGQWENENNEWLDVFLYDRVTGTTELVSHTSSSRTATGSGSAWQQVISADGRYVAFASDAPDLIEGRDPEESISDNVFLYDRISGKVELVSHTNNSTRRPGNQTSYLPAISADGRFVAFLSYATNLVAGQRDTNNERDVFLYDRLSKQVTLLSHASSSPTTTGNGSSSGLPPVISADGSTVVFDSTATNLVPGQGGPRGVSNLFLFHRPTGRTSLVSHASSSPVIGGSGDASVASVSADGSFVAFTSAAGNHVDRQTVRGKRAFDAFLYSRATGRITLLSGKEGSPSAVANANSFVYNISADGNLVLLGSAASDLVPGIADPNRDLDVFLYDRRSGRATLVSHGATAEARTGNRASLGAALSADGKWIAFASNATDLISGIKDFNQSEDVFLEGTEAGRELVSRRAPDLPSDTPQTESRAESISADGRFIAFVTRTRNSETPERNVFLHDRVTGTTRLVSRTAASPSVEAGGMGPLISADGRFVAFWSNGLDLVAGQVDQPGTPDFFLYDRLSGVNTLVTHAPGAAATALASRALSGADLSANGRFVVFASHGLFLFDRQTGDVAPVGEATRFLWSPRISADGRVIAFAIDENDIQQIYLYDRRTETLILATPSCLFDSEPSFGYFEGPLLSADGSAIAFTSDAWDLVPNDFNVAPAFSWETAASYADAFVYSVNGSAACAGSGTLDE
ncbi:MAG TPA: hypothetical protein VE685_03560 [Thermoanaerobaculia bacterium]|nr:hypothetical protein [Thermoanaerobaculia bacterium]